MSYTGYKIREKRARTPRRIPRRLPLVLTEQDQTALLKQPNPRYPTGERNRLLIQLYLGTGLRLSEGLSLRWEDIDLLSGQLKVVQGKGAKDRVLWVNSSLLAALQRWRKRQVQVVGKRMPASPSHIFTTLQGRPLSQRYTQQMIARCAVKAGITKRVHPHMLRHTFATDLYRKTHDLLLVQRALGHSNLRHTLIYTHLVDGQLEQEMKAFRTKK